MPPKKTEQVKLLPKDWDDFELLVAGATLGTYLRFMVSITANSSQNQTAKYGLSV